MSVAKFISVLFILLMSHKSLSSRVLVIPAHNMASHTKSMYPFVERLASENHEVYMFQILRGEKEKAKGKHVKDIYLTYPVPPDTKIDHGVDGSMLWTRKVNQPIGILFPWYHSSLLCADVLNNSKLADEFFKVVKQHWDYILVDNIFAPCGILAIELNPTVPWIEFSTSLVMIETLNVKGPQYRPSYMPFINPPGRFDAGNFFDRFWNVYDVYASLATFYVVGYYLPQWVNDPIAKDLDWKKFVSGSRLSLGSMPYELDFAHPKSIDVIEMDASCPKASELHEPYLSFVEDPKSKGTILFAMGHMADFEHAPPHVLSSFVDAFNELSDYRIIWQYVSKGEKPKVGRHVMLEKWIPQGGILHHNKTVLFFSHLGFKSFRESICDKVPIVGLPMFAEQSRNAAVAKRHGFGEYVDKTKVTKEGLLNVLRKVLQDPTYKINVGKMKELLDDRIMDTLKLGSFWTNFAMTHERADEFLRQKVPTFCCEYSSYFLFAAISTFFIAMLS